MSGTGEEPIEDWEALPEAPPLTPRPKRAQVTLRLPSGLLERIKRLAALRGMPYHALARSWLIAGLADAEPPRVQETEETNDGQLNLKLDQELLDQVKQRASELRRPYHRLAREWVRDGLEAEQQRLAVAAGEGSPVAPTEKSAASAYSSGGGGVVLEHRVGARYLALMLTGEGAPELGEGRTIRSIAFQQAPASAVDDIVVRAARAEEHQPSLELAVAVRRAPRFVASHADTQELLVDYLRALLSSPEDDLDRRFVLVVAGVQTHARELAELAAAAGAQMDAATFYTHLHTPKKHRKELVGRLDHLTKMTEGALGALSGEPADPDRARDLTWQLLCRLTVVMTRLEAPDAGDWADTQNRLQTVAREGTLANAGALLDRLATLSGELIPAGGTVDRSLLARNVHPLLEPGRRRERQGWRALEHLHTQAMKLRDRLGAGAGSAALHLDRGELAEQLLAASGRQPALLVHGESGVGKSALVVHTLAARARESDELEVVCLNLRQLPVSSLELAGHLGVPLQTLLGELSAPHRVLVIDAAETAGEGAQDTLDYLITAAREADVSVVVVTASESRRVLSDQLEHHLGSAPAELDVPGLSDGELEHVIVAFPQLARLGEHPRSRELLRRLVVVDLLVRSGAAGLPLSDIDAMREIWAGLVRADGHAGQSTPHARDEVALRLALNELTAPSEREATLSLDGDAVEALRNDGVLRPSSGEPWDVVPQFAHDELRRYAIARVLLANSTPAKELERLGAPRLALSAATLACQAKLAQFTAENPPPGASLPELQAEFDVLANGGHGARWADVPTEATLGLGEPTGVLSHAWENLREDDASGLKRLLRVLDQRHRDTGGIVDPLVAEPVAALLLSGETPWRESKETASFLREWLTALVVADAPQGNPLRRMLRDRILAYVSAVDARARKQADAEARACAERTPKQILQERKLAAEHRDLFREIGVGRRERRRRADVPRELTDDTVLELLALLGRDLGNDGAQLLRRVAAEAPWHLAPAVEELFTGRSLALYGDGLLAELTEAYYIDDEPSGGGFPMDDGIRDHHSRLPIAPMAAFYRGPFVPLLQSDLRRGVALLNRMLNHAARYRARTLAGLGDPWGRSSPEAVEHYSQTLSITGESRTYVGDQHVWMWYRGTGVGPYPCMSALQACELVCEQLIAAEIPLESITTLLLEGCENLAMVGLVVGLLTRYAEKADPTIEPFLAEPAIWGLEFSRQVSESGGLASRRDGVVHPERRSWTMRELATWLIVDGDDQRAERLKRVGERLVANAERLEADYEAQLAAAGHDPPHDEPAVSYTTTVRNWASAFDRDSYRLYTQDGQTYLKSTPPADVEAKLAAANQNFARGHDTIRLLNRYFIPHQKPTETPPEPPSKTELETDLDTVKALLEDPPAASPIGVNDAAALVGAAALHAALLQDTQLAEDRLLLAAEILLAVADATPQPDGLEYDGTFFEQGADRTAAKAIPLLLLPDAAPLRRALGDHDGQSRILPAAHKLARALPAETRLYLARGLDALWRTPCDGAPCHHLFAFELGVESMRECVLGQWDQAGQRRQLERLDDPVADSLHSIEGQELLVGRLDPAMRALGVAAVSDLCLGEQPRQLLELLLDAQRRSLMAQDKDLDQRGSHALVAARALLTLAGAGEDAALLRHCQIVMPHAHLLGTFLRAVAGAAEETPERAVTASAMWPRIIETVLNLHAQGQNPFADHYYGDLALAALVPSPIHEIEFLYRELSSTPLAWARPLQWSEAIERWLKVAAGEPRCVDSLIAALLPLAASEQAETGLRWVRSLALGHGAQVANRSYALQTWLIEIRPAVEQAGTLADWQELVDELVVAGAGQLAGYSE